MVIVAVIPPIRRNAGYLVWECHFPSTISAAKSSPCPEGGNAGAEPHSCCRGFCFRWILLENQSRTCPLSYIQGNFPFKRQGQTLTHASLGKEKG